MADTTFDASKEPSIDAVERRARSLKEALREVRDEYADRNDTIVASRAADIAQLEALAEEIAPLVNDVDPADDRFEFMLGRGERPRYWIDMTTFVAMAQDRETFRLLKDTRMGRLVLSENSNLQEMGDQIASYVAERIIEREHMIEGDWHSTKRAALEATQSKTSAKAFAQPEQNAPLTKRGFEAPRPRQGSNLLGSAGIFLFGLLFSLATAALVIWTMAPEYFTQAGVWFSQLMSS